MLLCIFFFKTQKQIIIYHVDLLNYSFIFTWFLNNTINFNFNILFFNYYVYNMKITILIINYSWKFKSNIYVHFKMESLFMLKYTYRDRIGWRTNIFLSSLIQLFSARTIKHIKLISARNAWYEEIYNLHC